MDDVPVNGMRLSFQGNWVSRKTVLLGNAILVEDVGVMHSCMTLTFNLIFALIWFVMQFFLSQSVFMCCNLIKFLSGGKVF